jgi:hypothetical protein
MGSISGLYFGQWRGINVPEAGMKVEGFADDRAGNADRRIA